MTPNTNTLVLGEFIDRQLLIERPDIKKVFVALLNPKFKVRTFKGLIKETKLAVPALTKAIDDSIGLAIVVPVFVRDEKEPDNPKKIETKFALRARTVMDNPDLIHDMAFPKK